MNYLTISHPPTPHPSHTHNPSELHGALWPATNQIVGKDILRFHAVYWPAFLMAAKLPLPRRIISHAHWTMGKSKVNCHPSNKQILSKHHAVFHFQLNIHFQMSKSKANVVDPHDQISRFGVEPLRYFLLRESSLQQDGGRGHSLGFRSEQARAVPWIGDPHLLSVSLPHSKISPPIILSLSLSLTL